MHCSYFLRLRNPRWFCCLVFVCWLVGLLAGKGLLFAQQMTAYYFPQTWQNGTGSLFKTFTKAKISFMSARALATVIFHRLLFLYTVTLGTRFQACLLGEHESSGCSISVPQLLSQFFSGVESCLATSRVSYCARENMSETLTFLSGRGQLKTAVWHDGWSLPSASWELGQPGT